MCRMTRFSGLTQNQVLELRKKHGLNILAQKEGPGAVLLFLAQFESPLIYVLLFAAVISLIFREYTDLSLILIVITFNALMGFYQEYKAQKTMAALKNILKPKAFVIREAKRQEIEIINLVPGDLVVLTAGDMIPADGKLVEANNLLVSEAILTGEEEAVEKDMGRKNQVFMGTTVVAGQAILKVTEIGANTEMGKISKSLSEIKTEKTPLQIKLEKFSQKLAYIVAFICITIFIFGLFQNDNIWHILRVATVLAVAAIPEGLPVAVTVILSLGMKRILKRKGLVRKLLSVETLGSTSVICTDKTGTLTQGKMQVTEVFTQKPKQFLLSLILSNQQKDSLELSLWDWAKTQDSFDPQKILDSSYKIYEEPFDSDKKHSLVIRKINRDTAAYILGAPEIVLNFCKHNHEEKEIIIAKVEQWAKLGLKVLGSAHKSRGDLKLKENFTWLGLVGIADPLRPEVKHAIDECRQAGIKIKIVTGDYRVTAEKVAQNLGFKIGPENIMEAEELEKITTHELRERVDKIIIFSRITPHQKLKIIEALQENGEVVAMTGDGVNDALALKKADIAVVVENASDVAKEVSDLILLDSNFKTIVAACEEGRLILSNIRKVISYVLSNSFAEILLIFGAMLLNFPAPLTIVLILWSNLICDGPPGIVLGFEAREDGLMAQTPLQTQKTEIFDRSTIFLILTVSFTVGLSGLFIFWYLLHINASLELARTVVFAAVASSSLIYIFAFKNLKQTILKTAHFFENYILIITIALGFVLVFMAVYAPYINKVLGTTPLPAAYWLLVIGVCFLAIFWVEIIKIIKAKKPRQLRLG